MRFVVNDFRFPAGGIVVEADSEEEAISAVCANDPKLWKMYSKKLKKPARKAKRKK